MSEKRIKLKEVIANISMPKSIKIGDPLYLEEKNKKVSYIRSYRFKNDWVGTISLYEYESRFEINNKEESCIYSSFKIVLGKSHEDLDVYRDDKYYITQKEKITSICVDTAKYDVLINNKYINIHTGSDGVFGEVREYYRGTSLEGVLIDMDLGDFIDFNHALKKLEYLLDCNFQDVDTFKKI